MMFALSIHAIALLLHEQYAMTQQSLPWESKSLL